MDALEAMVYDRPSVMLWLGPRGGGKSFWSAFATHLDSIRHHGLGTIILGGSEAQSRQIYSALARFRDSGSFDSPVQSFGRERATYDTGSTVEFIAASEKSARGPHVARLRLDEVDEIEPSIREAAFGMCMEMDGVTPSVSMTSTYHRVGGPMKELLERGEAGDFPVFKFCVFEILERCPAERSGVYLENCSSCPIKKWCWSDIDGHGGGIPKAKRSNGHYTIDSLIQKVRGVSDRVFASDYLCEGPRVDGIWFTRFEEFRNVTDSAEFDPLLPAYISIDSGVFTGAVFLQVRDIPGGHNVSVFADYLSEGQSAEVSARSLLDIAKSRCGHARLCVSTDSSGGARNPVGPSVISEYERVGLRGWNGIQQWPKYPGCVSDGLATIEALLSSADGTVGLTIHPRCKNLIAAFKGYARAKRANQWMDYPEDPQHPHEDMIDPLRGQLALLFPEGRKPDLPYKREKIGRIF